MAPAERAALMQALAALSAEDPFDEPRNRRGRRFFVTLMAGCCAWLIPWIIYLSYSLPEEFTAEQWRVAWTGFDIALLLAMSGTGLAIWRKRQIAIVGMIVTGTLLICDAWFDVLLSWGSTGMPASVTAALLGELPLGALCFFVARRLVRLTIHAAWVRGGFLGPEPALHRIRLFTLVEPPDPRD
jgi:hypothetical protein